MQRPAFGSIIIGSVVGCTLLSFGMIFLLIGSISWGVMESRISNKLFPTSEGTMKMPNQKEATFGLFKIFAISMTVLGFALIMCGVFACTVSFCTTTHASPYEMATIYNVMPSTMDNLQIYHSYDRVSTLRNLSRFHDYPEIRRDQGFLLYATGKSKSQNIVKKAKSEPLIYRIIENDFYKSHSTPERSQTAPLMR